MKTSRPPLLPGLWCWLAGHARTERIWEAWQRHGELGRYRLLLTRCERCRTVYRLDSEVEDAPC